MVLFGTPAGSAGELPFVRFAAFFRKLYRVVAHGEYPAIGVESLYMYMLLVGGWIANDSLAPVAYT